MHEDYVTYMSVKFVFVTFFNMWIEKWRGIVVNASRVLNNNSLVGTLPPDIGNFSYFVSL